MQCNIDSRGKAVRLVWGMACLIAGALCTVLWAWPTGDWRAWTVSGLVLAFGALGVFEGRAGWCIVRAMGFKTPI